MDAKMRDLLDERRDLTEELAFCLDLAHESETARIEHARTTGIGRAPTKHEAEFQAAEAALMAFDAAHPEVKAHLEAERAERIERFSRID